MSNLVGRQRGITVSGQTALASRLLFPLLYLSLGSVMLPVFSGCSSSQDNLQSRIEKSLTTPDNGQVKIGTATYNRTSQGFEDPWPFGPYSD
jgi:hypothetical protein